MLQKAVIIDLDGTLVNSPQPSEEHMVNDKMCWDTWIRSTKFSPINEWCKDITIALALDGYHIIFLTARSETAESKKITENWLATHIPINYSLYMRDENDFRHDNESKRDIYINQIAPNYNVMFAVDDKKSNCDLFRSLGIPALHCADY